MKRLNDILKESILDDEDVLAKPIEDFRNKPFQSIFNCGPKIKNQRDWEDYVNLFEVSIKAECDYSFEHGVIMYIPQKDIKNNGYYPLKMRDQITVK